MFRPPPAEDLAEGEDAIPAYFWIQKIAHLQAYDLVVMGDSRVYRSISPQAMQAYLPGYRILNFGFSAGGLNSVMYAEAERRLDPGSDIRTIVLGVTPHALTPSTMDNAQYVRLLAMQRSYVDLLPLPVLDFFSPIAPEDILAIVNPPETHSDYYYQEWFADGWIASNREPPDPSRGLRAYSDIFDDNQVSSLLLEALYQQVAVWTQAGIQVYGFRVPTTTAMVELENASSGFDEEAFRIAFEDAGGIWFSFPVERYASYDSSHLHRDSAVLLSGDLAGCIADLESCPFR